MLCISLFDLIPESLTMLKVKYAFIGIILFLIVFFITNILFNKINFKIEKGSSLYKIGVLSSVTLFIHNIPEGILTFNTTYSNFDLGLKTSFAIALHNIPEGIAVSIPIYYATNRRGRALFLTFVSGISEPVAGIISNIFIKDLLNENLIGIMMIFAASLMIFLSVYKLYPEVLIYKEKKSMYLGFILGLFLFINIILF